MGDQRPWAPRRVSSAAELRANLPAGLPVWAAGAGGGHGGAEGGAYREVGNILYSILHMKDCIRGRTESGKETRRRGSTQANTSHLFFSAPQGCTVWLQDIDSQPQTEEDLIDDTQ